MDWSVGMQGWFYMHEADEIGSWKGFINMKNIVANSHWLHGDP
jgi:hypothetical protein